MLKRTLVIRSHLKTIFCRYFSY